jgi:endonuclease/exonuclease/phosphatase family metal-dependent hydrolase
MAVVLCGCFADEAPVSIPAYTPADAQGEALGEVQPPVDSGAEVAPGDAASATEAGDAAAAEAAADVAPPARLVVVTLNTHSFQEGSDSLDKLQSIGQGLASIGADLVGLNEVMSGTFWSYDYNGAVYDGAELIRSALQAASGTNWYLARKGFAHWSSGEEMSNVVLSRTPLLEMDSLSLTTTDAWPGPGEKRNAVFARTQIPGFGLVNFFVTHTWGWASADTLPQVQEVKTFMQGKRQGNEALEVLAGDLNVTPSHGAYAAWLGPQPFGLLDTFAHANPGGAAEPTTFDGNRIDYILVRDDAALASHCTSYLAFDGAGLPVVSDHKAVVTVFTTGEGR